MKKHTLVASLMLFFPLLLRAQNEGLDDRINQAFTPIADWWVNFVFTSIPLTDEVSLPIVLILLIGGALFFTIYFNFINIRRFGLAIRVVSGKYDAIEGIKKQVTTDTVNVVDGDIVDTIKVESNLGEVSHFQALSAAVSGTVGLGNIAGVAVAIVVGGPGATFWMIIAGLLGMSSKFVECTLGVSYRDVVNGRVYGGPMYYLSRGLRERGYPQFGKFLAVMFAILCVGASFGGGNMFQSNQAAAQIISQFGLESGAAGSILGLILAILVAIVIIGGIKRIGNIAEKIVPLMAILYVISCLIVIFINIGSVGSAFNLIITEAFSPTAVAGGFVGVLITGFRRAAFSNEAGVGSAAIAHSAVVTKYPASEGIVALLEPFIDTVVICTMTALVIVITGLYNNPENLNGVDLTTSAFESSLGGSSYLLTVAIVLFAFSTMLSWSYYGLQSWMYLFGRSKGSDMTYKVLFLLFIVIGAASTLDAVINFSDAMILAMVFPNMIGLFFLFPRVRQELIRYIDAIRFGE